MLDMAQELFVQVTPRIILKPLPMIRSVNSTGRAKTLAWRPTHNQIDTGRAN